MGRYTVFDSSLESCDKFHYNIRKLEKEVAAMQLLVAEDDPKLLKSLVHIFESNNYATDGVSDGGAAFD